MQLQDFVKQNLYKILIINLFVLTLATLIKQEAKAAVIEVSNGGWTFSIEINETKIRTRYGSRTYLPSWSNWIDIYGKGSTESGNISSRYRTWIETNNGNIRLVGLAWSSGWVRFTDNFKLSAGDGPGITYEVVLEKSNGKMRACIEGVCSGWVNVISCPSGYKYEPNRNICIAQPKCNNGTYDPVVKKCYIGDYTCPLGNSYECLKLSDGKNYCSNIYCADASSPNTYENIDTPTGVNDKQANGQIDENGNCLGTIYIFNGQDKRCRLSGTQTYFNDCCKDDSIELAGLVKLGKCNSDEVYLVKLREWGQRDGKCHYIGKYCAERWKLPGGSICVQKKKTFCCFNSPLARIIQEQGRQQLGIDWGTPTSPNCRGFTPKEFQKLDWNKIDFSEWIEGEIIPNVQNNLQQNINNTVNQIKANIQNRY